MPDRFKTDFLNSLSGLNPLFKSELDYMLAYRLVQL
jgi:hypothetical protein